MKVLVDLEEIKAYGGCHDCVLRDYVDCISWCTLDDDTVYKAVSVEAPEDDSEDSIKLSRQEAHYVDNWELIMML